MLLTHYDMYMKAAWESAFSSIFAVKKKTKPWASPSRKGAKRIKRLEQSLQEGLQLTHDNATLIADSNHGWKMIGVGHLIADELLGESQELLEPFRFDRFEKGNLHPVSNSPYPWS